MICWIIWKVIVSVGMMLFLCMEIVLLYDRVEVCFLQCLDVLIDVLVIMLLLISLVQLYELGIIVLFFFEKDVGLCIYWLQLMLIVDGYVIDNVEYCVICGKDDDICFLFVMFVDMLCFLLEWLVKCYVLQLFIYLFSYGVLLSVWNYEQYYLFIVGVQEIIICSQCDVLYCVLGLRC